MLAKYGLCSLVRVGDKDFAEGLAGVLREEYQVFKVQWQGSREGMTAGATGLIAAGRDNGGEHEDISSSHQTQVPIAMPSVPRPWSTHGSQGQ